MPCSYHPIQTADLSDSLTYQISLEWKPSLSLIRIESAFKIGSGSVNLCHYEWNLRFMYSIWLESGNLVCIGLMLQMAAGHGFVGQCMMKYAGTGEACMEIHDLDLLDLVSHYDRMFAWNWISWLLLLLLLLFLLLLLTSSFFVCSLFYLSKQALKVAEVISRLRRGRRRKSTRRRRIRIQTATPGWWRYCLATLSLWSISMHDKGISSNLQI